MHRVIDCARQYRLHHCRHRRRHRRRQGCREGLGDSRGQGRIDRVQCCFELGIGALAILFGVCDERRNECLDGSGDECLLALRIGDVRQLRLHLGGSGGKSARGLLADVDGAGFEVLIKGRGEALFRFNQFGGGDAMSRLFIEMPGAGFEVLIKSCRQPCFQFVELRTFICFGVGVGAGFGGQPLKAQFEPAAELFLKQAELLLQGLLERHADPFIDLRWAEGLGREISLHRLADLIGEAAAFVRALGHTPGRRMSCGLRSFRQRNDAL